MKMKIRYLLFFLIVCLVFPLTALGEDELHDQMISEDWTWEAETVNVIRGDLDLSEFEGQELTLRIQAAYQPEPDETDTHPPVFVIVNGSRITILNQRDTAQFTPDAEHPDFRFDGSLRMPGGVRLRNVTLTLTASDGNGKELKRCSAEFSLGGDSQGDGPGVFYISFDLRSTTIILAAAALLVWGIAIIRNRMLNKTKKRGRT